MNDPHTDEATARNRYIALNAVRIGALGAVVLGIAGARGAADLPYPVAIVLAVAGLLGFFFAPRLLARRWKSPEDHGPR